MPALPSDEQSRLPPSPAQPWNKSGKNSPKPGRRKIHPSTCNIEYSAEEVTFMTSLDRYKRANSRPYPTCKEVLEVLHSLGYRKVAEAGPLPGIRTSGG